MQFLILRLQHWWTPYKALDGVCLTFRYPSITNALMRTLSCIRCYDSRQILLVHIVAIAHTYDSQVAKIAVADGDSEQIFGFFT